LYFQVSAAHLQLSKQKRELYEILFNIIHLEQQWKRRGKTNTTYTKTDKEPKKNTAEIKQVFKELLRAAIDK